jgi:hypothetical protein
MKEGWGPDCGPYIEFYRDDEMGWRDRKEWTPLYTTPPAAQPAVPLTDAEIEQLASKHLGVGDGERGTHYVFGEIDFARAILAAAQPAPKNRKDALRQLLLLEDGLTAKECEWVNEVNEGDKVKLRGGQSVAAVKSVYRQKGLAPDYYTLILAGGDTLELSGDELADLYEPAAQPAPDLQSELEATNRQVEILTDALAESRREVVALAAPVAWLFKDDWGRKKIAFSKETANEWGTEVQPLYTTSPPAEFVCSTRLCHYKALPDAMTSADIQEHIEYVAGWNDYRKAMLEMMK